MTRVHFAKPTDIVTACGKVALLNDGTRLLETDTSEQQVNCKICSRILAKANGGLAR
jgi:hypothetical protein